MSGNHVLMTKKEFISTLRAEIDRVINAGEKGTFVPVLSVVQGVEGGSKITDAYIRNTINRTKSVRLMGMVASVRLSTTDERGSGWLVTLMPGKNPDPTSRLARTKEAQQMKVAITIVQVLAKLEEKGVTAASLLSGDIVDNVRELMEGGGE